MKQNIFRERFATYIAVARNPKLKFKGSLMEQLGLSWCPVCKSKDIKTHIIGENYE